MACQNGHKEVAVLLIEAGADVAVKDKVMINDGIDLFISNIILLRLLFKNRGRRSIWRVSMVTRRLLCC